MQTGTVLTGMITKAIGGLYTVESPSGVMDCRARGIFRNRGQSPMVGDRAEVRNGVIDRLLPRKNSLIRPPLANLDQLLFVVSMYKPAPNLLLLDKFIAIAEYKHITPVLVVTKVDLEDPAYLVDIYRKAGIPVHVVDYAKPETVDAVAACLSGKLLLADNVILIGFKGGKAGGIRHIAAPLHRVKLGMPGGMPAPSQLFADAAGFQL